MDWFDEGAREWRRRAFRLARRLALSRANRKLRAAEVALGQLGWLQADFSPDLQAEIDAIQDSERQQASLENRSAELAESIANATRERGAASALWRSRIERLEADLTTEAKGASPEREIRAAEEAMAGLERDVPDTERRREETRAAYEQFLREAGGSPAFSAKKMALLDMRTAAERACEELASAILKAENRLRELRDATTGRQRRLVELKSALDKKRRDRDEEMRAWKEQLRKLHAEKARVQSDETELEHGKDTHYLHLGRCLADAGIPPMNQPGALTQVLFLREQASQVQSALTESLEESRRADPVAIRKFDLAAGSAVALVVCLVLLIFITALVR